MKKEIKFHKVSESIFFPKTRLIALVPSASQGWQLKRLFLIEETHLPQEKQLVEGGHLMNDQEQGIFKDAAISSSP